MWCPCAKVRDLYWTFRNFRNRVADFLRYRRVTANMDERFGDATAEDLARCDGICIICREDLAPGARNKKLPCNHVFHMHCLRCAVLQTLLLVILWTLRPQMNTTWSTYRALPPLAQPSLK